MTKKENLDIESYIEERRTYNVKALALRLAGERRNFFRKEEEKCVLLEKKEATAYILRQVEGWQKLSKKVPSWSKIPGIRYPGRISLEQCSGEAAAGYKAEIIKRKISEKKLFADLTGGLGVDFWRLAALFEKSVYVERRNELCVLARHNFPLLGLKQSSVQKGDGVEWLSKQSDDFSCVFLDPSRRDEQGRKTICIEDCEPDLSSALPLLLEKSPFVMAKLSPMLDWRAALERIPHVSEVHIFSEHGECKELLLVMERGVEQEPLIVCQEGNCSFSFRRSREENQSAEHASEIGSFLYEPGPAILKSGAFKSLGAKYGIRELHPNSHLYTSEILIEHFPGRCFAVKRVCGFGKKELKSFCKGCDRANLTIRNFPSTVEDLRKRLRIKEGGDEYWFATTLQGRRKVIVSCKKITSSEV